MTTDTKPTLLPAARLAEIRERASAATRGPWRSTWGDDEGADAERGKRGEEVTIEAVGLEGLARIVLGVTWYDGPHPCCREEDAAFIAHAREDVPALLAHLDALTAELAEARARVERAEKAMRLRDASLERIEANRAEKEAAARREGARDERRLCLADCANEADSKAGQAIAERIRARGDATPVEGEDGAT